MRLVTISMLLAVATAAQAQDRPTPQQAAEAAAAAITAIRTADLATLAELAHPVLGVRLSPVPAVQKTDIIVYQKDIRHAQTKSVTFMWGTVGEPGPVLNLTFMEYYARYVYDRDYAGQAANRYFRGGQPKPPRGASVKDIEQAYPQGTWYAFRHPGTGIRDWRMIYLVFERHEDRTALVAIAHEQFGK